MTRRFFLVLNWTTNSWRGIKNLFRSRQRESKKILSIRPKKWQAKVQPNKTDKRQLGKCQGRLSHIQKKKEEKYKTELILSRISKTVQGTYFTLIATLNFQCFRLDTSFFFQFCHRRGKRCKLFSFSSKWFGNLKKDIIDKRLVNSACEIPLFVLKISV